MRALAGAGLGMVVAVSANVSSAAGENGNRYEIRTPFSVNETASWPQAGEDRVLSRLPMGVTAAENRGRHRADTEGHFAFPSSTNETSDAWSSAATVNNRSYAASRQSRAGAGDGQYDQRFDRNSVFPSSANESGGAPWPSITKD